MTTWPTRQLAEFLAAVSGFRDEASATRGAAAELAAVAAAGGHGPVELPGLGPCRTLVTSLDHLQEGRLVLARSSGGFSGEEADLARGMGRVLALTVQMLRGIEEAERRGGRGRPPERADGGAPAPAGAAVQDPAVDLDPGPARPGP